MGETARVGAAFCRRPECNGGLDQGSRSLSEGQCTPTPCTLSPQDLAGRVTRTPQGSVQPSMHVPHTAYDICIDVTLFAPVPSLHRASFDGLVLFPIKLSYAESCTVTTVTSIDNVEELPRPKGEHWTVPFLQNGSQGVRGVRCFPGSAARSARTDASRDLNPRSCRPADQVSSPSPVDRLATPASKRG